MTFRDITFCRTGHCTRAAYCYRAITPAVKAAGECWWGSPDFPMSTFEKSPVLFACYSIDPQDADKEHAKTHLPAAGSV